MQVFLCGPLADDAVLDVVLAAPSPRQPAVLADHRLAAVPTGFGAALCQAPGRQVTGVVLTLDDTQLDRLRHFALSFGSGLGPVTLPGGQTCQTCLPILDAPAPDWDATPGQAQDAALLRGAAIDVMAAFGQISADRLFRRLEQIRVRAASRLRAQDAAPHSLRSAPSDIAVRDHRHPYAHFFGVEEFDLSFPRFDGTPSPVVTRAVFVSGDAVTVLPYDPVRDRVLLVEQFRAGPFGRGDANPWQLEAIAGRVDPGEPPETCARREAHEEAGLTLGPLHLVGAYYPSPGAKTEFVYSYVALTDLPDGSAGVFGVEDEAEDIRGHLISFDDAMALVASGEVQTAPLILTLQWLQRERPRLRG